MTTTTTSTVLGRPLWYELMTTDMKAAEKFYDARASAGRRRHSRARRSRTRCSTEAATFPSPAS